MKSPDTAERISIGANSRNGGEGCGRARYRYGSSSALHKYLPAPHRVDGSDELAASIRERSGRVRFASRISRAADAGASEFETQEGARASSGQPGRRGKPSRGGAGSFRQLSRDPVNVQVW